MSRPVCGFLGIELRMAENSSLKDKRQIVKSLKDRLRRAFNVAVAELEPLDDYRLAVLGLVTLSKDRSMVESTLRRALDFVEKTHMADITDSHIDFW